MSPNYLVTGAPHGAAGLTRCRAAAPTPVEPEFTLDNLVIDNFYFGVSAVAPDGSETPVVFPGPPGSFGGYE